MEAGMLLIGSGYFFDGSTVQQKEDFLNGKDEPVAMAACDAVLESVHAKSEADG